MTLSGWNHMRILKMALVGAIILTAVLGLLWATEIVPRDDIGELARMGYGALFVLVLAGAALRLFMRPRTTPDATDRPVP